MSLAKIPFVFLFSLAFNKCITSPNPTPPKTEWISENTSYTSWYYQVPKYARVTDLTLSITDISLMSIHPPGSATPCWDSWDCLNRRGQYPQLQVLDTCHQSLTLQAQQCRKPMPYACHPRWCNHDDVRNADQNFHLPLPRQALSLRSKHPEGPRAHHRWALLDRAPPELYGHFIYTLRMALVAVRLGVVGQGIGPVEHSGREGRCIRVCGARDIVFIHYNIWADVEWGSSPSSTIWDRMGPVGE